MNMPARKKMGAKDLPRLAKAITDDYTTGQRCAVSMCYNLGYAWEIWHQRDDDDGFWDWLADETPAEVGGRRGKEYLQIYKNVLAESANDLREVPVTKLLELSRTASNGNQNRPAKPALPKKKRDSLLKKLTSDNPPTTKEIKEEVRKALPSSARTAWSPPARVERKPFAARLAECHKANVGAEYLFDLHPNYCLETAKVLVKHWKQKHHPDRGGDPDDFALITKKGEDLNV